MNRVDKSSPDNDLLAVKWIPNDAGLQDVEIQILAKNPENYDFKEIRLLSVLHGLPLRAVSICSLIAICDFKSSDRGGSHLFARMDIAFEERKIEEPDPTVAAIKCVRTNCASWISPCT